MFIRKSFSVHPWVEFDVVTQPDETCRKELQRQQSHLC